MGTSQSSSGSPSNVPMVPPWVPDAPPADADGHPDGAEGNGNDGDAGLPDGSPLPEPPPPPVQPVPLAPRGRFGPARTSLGRFARTGTKDDMRRGVGHYVRKGLGGAPTAARRFGGTANTAGALYDALSALAEGRSPEAGNPLDPALLQGRSADDVMDAVVEALRPIDGTQDTEASRDAMNDALAELLGRHPDADLLNLTESQRLFAIEQFAALDVFNRFQLDVGKTLQKKAPNPRAALSRLKEVRDYIREGVAAAVRKTQSGRQALNARRVSEMVREALRDAFNVFEGYLA